MPCLNEAETVEGCIKKAQAWLRANECDGKVVVADNGSTDASTEIAERCGARVIRVPVRGYGAALYFGSRATRGRFIILGDAGSYDFSSLTPFIEQLRAGCDPVMGNRYRGSIEPRGMPWKNRYIGNPVLTWIGRLFFRSSSRDFHCGLRGYTREAFDHMDLHTTGMEFASEVVIKATLLRMRIAEVPTVLGPDGRSRPPHLRPWRHLRFMLLYSPCWLFPYPGPALGAAGFLVGVWLLGGQRHIGRAALDVHTLLYAAVVVLLGYQTVLFAVFARIFAMTQGLLPPQGRMKAIFKHVTLESGLMLGLALLFAGFGGSLATLLGWRRTGYGPFSCSTHCASRFPRRSQSHLEHKPSSQAFFLSVLGLDVRRLELLLENDHVDSASDRG
jgi:hypothetical protein